MLAPSQGRELANSSAKHRRYAHARDQSAGPATFPHGRRNAVEDRSQPRRSQGGKMTAGLEPIGVRHQRITDAAVIAQAPGMVVSRRISSSSLACAQAEGRRVAHLSVSNSPWTRARRLFHIAARKKSPPAVIVSL